MLVICEDCAKKYNIDETRIKGKKAKFSCRSCGHIIIVEKPVKEESVPEETSLEEETGESGMESQDSTEASDATDTKDAGDEGEQEENEQEETDQVEKDQEVAEQDDPDSEEETSAPLKKKKSKTVQGKGISISFYLLFTMIVGFVTITGAFAYLYFTNVPDIINRQIALRTEAITLSLSGAIKKPLLLKNYLQVNKEAQRIAKLPGVAYASVINKKGIVVAGFFSDRDRFDDNFKQRINEEGFPVEIVKKNPLAAGVDLASSRIMVGGQTIYDQVVATPDTGGEVHVGIYISEVDQEIRNALFSPLALSVAGVVFLTGCIAFFLLSKTITRPMRELTNVANRISLGETELTVAASGPREMRELAVAFERMRCSVNMAINAWSCASRRI